MKKVLSIFLAVIMLTSALMLSGSVLAEEAYQLTVTDVKGSVGDTVTVDIALNNPYGFGGLAYDVIFDSTVLKPISYTLGLGADICVDSGIDRYENKLNFQYGGL